MTGPTRTLFICQGTGCVSSKSPEIRAALQDEAVRLGTSAASLTLRYPGTVVPELSLEKLYDELVI